ncbi:MAG: EAL domain-containing protein [Betaproteobacteria bacterium]|nr:EAL domain-containing protein [Betaproteobacteria bacterium]
MSGFPVNDQGLYKARVLVVEDDSLLRTQTHRMAAKLAAEVRVAEDGATGLALWRDWQPDLTITDILMPVMDGLSMSQRIRYEDAHAQIIVATSSSETEHLRKALDIGIDRYVLKPLDEPLLHDAMHKCLRDRAQHLELRLARMVFESVAEGIMVTEKSGRIVAVNPAFSEVTGYRADEALGNTPALLSSGQHSVEFYRHMRESLASVGRWSGEITNRRKDGELYTEWLNIVTVENGAGREPRFVGLFSDITERKRAEEHIRRLAHFDSLTGLPNRVMFMDHIRRSLARVSRTRGSLAVLYIDLDRFKNVNDLHGHAFGDQVLIEAARRMTGAIREGDMISRRGGDEFVALIESESPRQAASLVGNKLIQMVSQPYRINGIEACIGASIGAAVYPEDGEAVDSLLNAADAALYEAKRHGRGILWFPSPDATPPLAHGSMESLLARGLEEDRFELRFLPEIDLRTGAAPRIEALMRLRHPERGLIEAAYFTDTAERIGVMHPLLHWTFRQALTALNALGPDGPGLTMDFSARQLAMPGHPDVILQLLQEFGIEPHRITLEFSEPAVTGNEEGLHAIYQLVAQGFDASLDDFGAGYCSFDLLRQLPLASIKIDQSFIEEIDQEPQSRELVAALLAFGKRLGLRTVAEGVNTPAQLAFLRENGCDAAQGFLFGQPLHADELPAYLAAQSWKDWL